MHVGKKSRFAVACVSVSLCLCFSQLKLGSREKHKASAASAVSGGRGSRAGLYFFVLVFCNERLSFQTGGSANVCPFKPGVLTLICNHSSELRAGLSCALLDTAFSRLPIAVSSGRATAQIVFRQCHVSPGGRSLLQLRTVDLTDPLSVRPP